MSESVPNAIEEISEADWSQTPESVKRLVQSLLGRIEQLERQGEELRAEIATLQEQVKRNSKNSSKPPSQDIAKGFKPKVKRTESKKARGAQFGHAGHPTELYPVESCESVNDYYPEHCIECEAPLSGHDPAPYRVQQIEIPPVLPIVREHRFHTLRCECCGTTTRAWDEEIINGSRYGERVVAIVGILSGLYRQSHRMVQGLLSELFGVPLSLGSINHLRQQTSASVAEAVEEARHYVQQQGQVNMDETVVHQIMVG